MDHRRASARLRACVRDVGEWFAAANSSARRVRLLSRMDAANELAELVGELNREGCLDKHLDLLLSLADGCGAVADAAINATRQDQDPLVFAGAWAPLLGGALVVCCTLLINVARGAQAQQQLASLVAAAVAMAHASLHLCRQLMRLPQEQPTAFPTEPCRWQLAASLDDCMRLQFRLLAECLVAAAGGGEGPPHSLAGLLHRALPARSVYAKLHGAVDVVEWVVHSGTGEGCATCLPALFILLRGVRKELLPVLCDDAPLLGRLARLTARVHAAHVAAARWQDPAWVRLHCSFLPWSGWWGFLPLAESHHAAMLPLLVAGGGMLRGEVSLLASLPAQPPAGADAEQAEQLFSCWLHSINITGRYLHLAVDGPLGAASQPSPSRLYQLLQLAGQSGQQAARFVHALMAAATDGPPDRQAAFASLLATSCKFTVGQALRSWTCEGTCLSLRCRAAGPAGTAAQQQEAAAAAAQLLGAQLDLLQMLAALAPSLEADARGTTPAGPAASGDAGSDSSDGGSPGSSCEAPDPAPLFEFDCLELVYAAAETAGLLAHRVHPRAAAPPSPLPLQRLHTAACHAVHCLLTLSPEALGASMLHPVARHQGRMDADAAAQLTGLLLDLSTALQAALLRAAPAADAEPGVAADWDRDYTRCLLELTAAVSALQPHTLGCKRGRSTKWLRPNTARQRAVAALQQLASPRIARLSGLCCGDDATTTADPVASSSSDSTGTPAGPLSEQGVLAALAGRLSDPASRELLPPLLARLLPPADDAGRDAALAPVPSAASVFQAQALAQRPCAHLLCGNLVGSSASLPTLRGKRCGGCRLVRFCSQACSVSAWPAHKPACRALAAAANGHSTQQ